MKTRFAQAVTAAMLALLLTGVTAGCGQKANGGSAVEQQKADVMGGPAPASAQAQIEAAKAQAQQRMLQAQQGQSR